jgi:mannose-6-phosphate isomerase
MEPFRFEPFLRPMVWGGRQLAERLGKVLPDCRPYGESWEISDHPLHRSVLAQGPYQGQTLRQLMRERRRELLGDAADRYESFPWLVKFLDAHDWLSVQVHPDEQAVRELWPGENGKTEAWFVLAAEPGSKIYAGLRPGVNEATLRQALTAGNVSACLHSFTPRPGDCVFLPAGTVHAVGGGVLLAEVQQTSDATFRMYDWDRLDAQGKARPLHIEQALQAIHWDQGPIAPYQVPSFVAGAERCERLTLVNCPHFRLEYVQPGKHGSLTGGVLRVVLVLRGTGTMSAGTGQQQLTPGAVWLIPAASLSVEFHSAERLGLLVSTFPPQT